MPPHEADTNYRGNYEQRATTAEPQGQAGLHRPLHHHGQEARRDVSADHRRATWGETATRDSSRRADLRWQDPQARRSSRTIYQFECKPDNETSIFGNARHWVGFLDNDPRVVQWQATHDAFFAGQELERQEKQGRNTNLIQRQLAPLKVAYNQMIGHRRAAFLAQIIGYVTGRVTKADLRWADTNEDDE